MSQTENATPIHEIKIEAAEWFAKLRAPEISVDIKQDFEHWKARDPRHELAYEQCSALWSMTESLRGDADIMRELELARAAVKSASKQSKTRHWLHGFLPTPLQASLASVLIVAVSYGVYNWPANDTLYSTQIGEQQLVKLADGSSITLNTDTQVRVGFTAKKRHIDLVKGEAYFVVSKDKKRPFEVVTTTGLVRAVGTEFNVAVTEHALTVDVAEGTVQLEAPTAQNPKASVIAQITLGQGVNFHAGDAEAKIQPAKLARVSAWKSNKIYFEASTLAEATAEYNRYSKERVVVVDNELNAQRITGLFNKGDADSFAFSLEQTLNARIERKPGLILVMKR